jgi:hypothetical protein
MKTLNIVLSAALLGTLTLGISATVDEQIAAIQNATPEERVELVNEFKTTLSTLTKEERMEATAKLRESMQGSGAELKMQTRTQTRTQTRVQDGEQSGEMLRSQNMHQNQAASQAKIQGGSPDNANVGGQGGFGRK